MVQRVLGILGVLFALLPAATAAAGPTLPPLGAWDLHEQRVVAHAGLLPPLDDGVLHGERPLSAAQLRSAFAAFAARSGLPPVAVPAADRLSVFTFDRLLVAQTGLGDVADAVQAEATRAGLRPPPSFGTEVVARLAGLRHDQPSRDDALELYPWQAITRAEAAWSLARVMDWDGSEQAWVRSVLAGFVLPPYDAGQRRVLRRAVAKIGMPYIWGGETDVASSYFGGQAHGGYDCSGFVWRLFKLGDDPAGRFIHGRVASDQAGEIPRSARIRLDRVRAGDLLFFGPGRFHQRATMRRITHVGIALSPQFMIHSSGSFGGVSVAPLTVDDGRHRHFSWARRVLR